MGDRRETPDDHKINSGFSEPFQQTGEILHDD